MARHSLARPGYRLYRLASSVHARGTWLQARARHGRTAVIRERRRLSCSTYVALTSCNRRRFGGRLDAGGGLDEQTRLIECAVANRIPASRPAKGLCHGRSVEAGHRTLLLP